MVNVSFATPMCVPVHWCVYVMNATMALIKVAVLYVVDLVFLMLITVKNVQFKRKMWVTFRKLGILNTKVNTIDSLHLKLVRRIKKKFVTLRENVEETNLRIT